MRFHDPFLPGDVKDEPEYHKELKRAIYECERRRPRTPTLRVGDGTNLDQSVYDFIQFEGVTLSSVGSDGLKVSVATRLATTPTPTSGGGTLTTTNGIAKYTVIDNRVIFSVTIVITTNGTGSGYISVPLSYTAAETTAVSGAYTATGISCSGYVTGSNLIVYKYDGTYPGFDGAIISVSGQFRV